MTAMVVHAACTRVLLGLVGALFAGCAPEPARPATEGWVITQVPVGSVARGSVTPDELDLRYPAGSRVVLVQGTELRELSAGLLAAGGPVVDPEGREVLFAGKRREGEAWQIFRMPRLAGEGGRVQVTEMEGGAGEPAWLPAGRIICTSPVPVPGRTPEGAPVPGLYSLSVTGGVPQRLTHGVARATDATVLGDGRILFVSEVPDLGQGESLFTINNDGSEVSAFAGQHAPRAALRRPRETADGRLMFLASAYGEPAREGRVEQVLLARPFSSRSVVASMGDMDVRAVEGLPTGGCVAAMRPRGTDGASGAGTFGIYRIGPGGKEGRMLVFDDPAWDEVEAVPASGSHRVMGRISSVDGSQATGTLLCLDVARSDREGPRGGAGSDARRVRVTRHRAGREPEVLGEIRVHEDGSFLASVPSDTALGFELLGGDGVELARCPPASWLRPGENRACIGCHEPHGRAPENRRPMAVRHPPGRLLGSGPGPGNGKEAGR